jgi:hypothetical protein
VVCRSHNAPDSSVFPRRDRDAGDWYRRHHRVLQHGKRGAPQAAARSQSRRSLHALKSALTERRVTTGNLSPAEIIRLDDPKLSNERAAALIANDVTLVRDDGIPVKTRAYAVSDRFFELFGVPLTKGGFSKEPPGPNTPPTVVISYRIWQDLYGGDPAVIGKPLRFAEIATSVIGVAPRDFDTPHGADFWVLMPLDPQGVNHSFEGFMRVKPGTTIERACSEMEGVMSNG